MSDKYSKVQILSSLDSMIQAVSQCLTGCNTLNTSVLLHSSNTRLSTTTTHLIDALSAVSSDNLFLKILIDHCNSAGIKRNDHFLLLLILLRGFFEDPFLVEHLDEFTEFQQNILHCIQTLPYSSQDLQYLIQEQITNREGLEDSSINQDQIPQEIHLMSNLNPLSILKDIEYPQLSSLAGLLNLLQDESSKTILQYFLKEKHLKQLHVIIMKLVIWMLNNNYSDLTNRLTFMYQTDNNQSPGKLTYGKNLSFSKSSRQLVMLFSGICIELSNYCADTTLPVVSYPNTTVLLCLQNLDFEMKNLVEYGEHLSLQINEYQISPDNPLSSILAFETVSKKIKDVFGSGDNSEVEVVLFFQKRVAQEFKVLFRSSGVLVIDSVGGVEIAKLKDILGIEPLPTILELTKEILDDREYALVVENIRIESQMKSTTQRVFLSSQENATVLIDESLLNNNLSLLSELKEFIYRLSWQCILLIKNTQSDVTTTILLRETQGLSMIALGYHSIKQIENDTNRIEQDQQSDQLNIQRKKRRNHRMVIYWCNSLIQYAKITSKFSQAYDLKDTETPNSLSDYLSDVSLTSCSSGSVNLCLKILLEKLNRYFMEVSKNNSQNSLETLTTKEQFIQEILAVLNVWSDITKYSF